MERSEEIIQTILCAAVLLAGSGVLSAQEQPFQVPDYVVDLVASTERTPLDAVPESDQLRFPRPDKTPNLPHEDRDKPVLAISLLTLGRSAYEVGDEFTYEVVVKNISGRSINLPTSPDAGRFRRGMPGARLAALSLNFSDAVLGKQTVGLNFLYGSEAVSGSLVTMQPGETMLIRATGHWYLISGIMPGIKPGMDSWRRELQLRALLHVHYTPEYWPWAWSEERVSVLLQK